MKTFLQTLLLFLFISFTGGLTGCRREIPISPKADVAHSPAKPDSVASGNQMRMINGGTVNFGGHIYFIDVQVTGNTAAVWLRYSQNMCSIYDKKVMNLGVSNPTLSNATNTICRAKSIYDSGKTVAGCLSVVASGACAGATVSSGGAAAALCTATWTYAVNTGMGDCVSGVTSQIGNSLGLNEWVTTAINANLTGAKWSSIISTAMSKACQDAH